MRHLIGPSLVFLLLIASSARAEEEEALSIPLGGQPTSLAEITALEAAVRQEIVQRVATPAADAAQQAVQTEVMEAQAAALQAAAALMGTLQDAPDTTTHLKEELVDARTALATLQQRAAAPPTSQLPVDEERSRALEIASEKAAQEVKDAAAAAAQLADQRKKLQAELDTREARRAELEEERRALEEQRDAIAEADTRARDLVLRRIQTNQVRQGILGLTQVHRATLIELDALRSDLAQVRIESAAANRRVCDAELEQARLVYQDQLEAEARRKRAEAERRLREADRADSAAGRAISRLDALVSQMETEWVTEQRLTSELKAVEAEGSALQQGVQSRYEALQLLFPPGVPLAPWQQAAISEQLRLLALERSAFDAYRDEVLPDLGRARAERLTERGQLEVFKNRTAGARDWLDRGRDEAAREEAIDRDLAHSVDPDYKLWLTARRDFLHGNGDSSLTPEDLAALRADWAQRATQVREIAKKRIDELDLQIKRIGEVQAIVDATTEGLAKRREYLDQITFWLRGDAMLSRASLGELGAEVGALKGRLAGIPSHVQSLRPAGVTASLTALLGALGALGLGLWLRRDGRSPVPAVADGDRRRAVLLRAIGQVARHVFLPAAFLAVAWFVRTVVLPGDPAGLVLVAVLSAWTGFALSRGIADAFLTPDANGRCAAGCTATTAARARRVMRLGFQGSAILFAGVLLFQAADAPRLAGATVFAWGLLGLFTGVLLVVWPDVLAFLVPLRAGTILARTIYGTLRVLWPLLLLFGVVVLAMYALGYRKASIHYMTRALLLGTLLGAIGVAYGILRLWLDAKRRPRAEEGAEDGPAGQEDLALGRRFLGGVLSLAALGGIWLAITAVFNLSPEDWRAFADLSLVGGAPGTGPTPGKIGHALFLLVLTLGVARYARDVVRGLLRTSKLPLGSRYAIRTLLFYGIVTAGVLLSLSALGISLDQFGWFLAAAGVGIGFGLQEIISNFVCGLILFFERPVQVGDIITVGDVEGDVTGISIRSTVVRTRDGVSMILPNKKLITEDVVNWSHGDQRTRLNVEVSVAYGSDVEKVKLILRGIAADERRALRYPAPEVDFRAFGESELQFVLRMWLATPDIAARRRIRTAVLTEVDARFAAGGIVIPFPQRDLHLRSSDVGRLFETMSEQAHEPSDADADADADVTRPGARAIPRGAP